MCLSCLLSLARPVRPVYLLQPSSPVKSERRASANARVTGGRRKKKIKTRKTSFPNASRSALSYFTCSPPRIPFHVPPGHLLRSCGKSLFLTVNLQAIGTERRSIDRSLKIMDRRLAFFFSVPCFLLLLLKGRQSQCPSQLSETSMMWARFLAFDRSGKRQVSEGI